MAWVGSWLRYMARMRLAPYVPSPPVVSESMLTLANFRAGERLVDLGSGDGRLLLHAVERGAASAVGYELDHDLVEESKRRVAAAGANALVRIHQRDALQSAEDLSSADVVTVYLTERGNEAILPLLRSALKPEARVVSYVWGMGSDLPPTRTTTVTGPGCVVQFPNVLLWEREDLLMR